MSRKTVTGSTKQAARSVTEKKQKKEKPKRLTNEEKIQKFGKNEYLSYKINFKPKNEKQLELFNIIMEKQLIVSTGEAGSGKSYTCLSAALKLLKEDNTYKQIMIVVPTVESGNMGIGYLPGDINAKIQPYLDADIYTITKILDYSGNDGESYLKELLSQKLIIGQPISFMRGKTIDNTIVIISESENFNQQELFLLLSRMSDTSKYILNGDNKQMDRKDIKKELNGLQYAEKVLKDKLNEVGFCHFSKEHIVRSKLISKIMDLWFPE